MPSVEKTVAALERIDWDFPQSGNMGTSIHGLHWFPGNFIAQIPSFLIQILSQPGEWVLDPFVGSGTTAVEANRLGRHAIVGDRLLPCVCFSAAKVSVLHNAIPMKYIHEVLHLLWWDEACESDKVGRKGEGAEPTLNSWFSPRTLSQLRYIWSVIEDSPLSARAVLLVLFSDTLFACASTKGGLTSTGARRRHHWGWVADNVVPRVLFDHSAIAAFRQRLVSVLKLESERNGISAKSLVVQQDARQLGVATESIDLVVTSPPYIGMIDYAKANRLLYLWMGWSLEERDLEIGARYKRGRKKFRAEYDESIDECWREIVRVLKNGRYCAVVIGESHRYEGTVREMLGRWCTGMDLVWGPVRRVPQRRRLSERAARVPREYICVFRKTE